MCRQAVTGALYRNELLAADKEGRICRVPYDASKPDELRAAGLQQNQLCGSRCQDFGFMHKDEYSPVSSRGKVGPFIHFLIIYSLAPSTTLPCFSASIAASILVWSASSS